LQRQIQCTDSRSGSARINAAAVTQEEPWQSADTIFSLFFFDPTLADADVDNCVPLGLFNTSTPAGCSDNANDRQKGEDKMVENQMTLLQ
jgi:hypothetical protein